MYEEENGSPEEVTERKPDAIEVGDFVYAATGARVRRVTLRDGTHWFPAKDVASGLGYSNPRQAIRWHVEDSNQLLLGDIAPGGYGLAPARKGAAHGLRTTMKMVNLQGLINLVNGCTKPECQPFKKWVAEVIATIQRDGSYSLEPAPAQQLVPAGGPACVMPPEVIDAIVRLEERNLRADEALVAMQAERVGHARRSNELLTEIARAQRETCQAQQSMADALHQIAQTLGTLGARRQEAGREPGVTPQELLDVWRRRKLVVTEDVHAVAAFIVPALIGGEARYRLEEIAARTGLSTARVHACLRMLIKHQCIRQVGCAPDGAPVYVLVQLIQKRARSRKSKLRLRALSYRKLLDLE
ncbi:BRO-N domain-containing protein [Streptomyces candidus]|uniref:Prophage antirepressor-like protein n=1 Tax=Streptomyces candidus TaxID=67283 RepID=A0A7X0LR72_9ACTN|nr:Bro-N domain-containing protein [Streptomyces candidus]MBB6437189.1 prophage antirepressor-like protein [Streptomyces candidus]GHH38148.1 DNA-binding protein [Streptomyces candidus]